MLAIGGITCDLAECVDERSLGCDTEVGPDGIIECQIVHRETECLTKDSSCQITDNSVLAN